MISPQNLSNDELERAARDRDDPLLQEVIRRLLDGEGNQQDDFDAYQDDVAAAELECDRLREELEAMGELCQEAAKALHGSVDAEDRADLIKRLEAA